MVVEGVEYFRYVFRYTLEDGRRRRKVLWCPGVAWLRDVFDRFVHYNDVPIKRDSNVYVREG